jgi:hypothetical protein
MKYDEIRVVLSATPKGRFKTQVSMAGAAPISGPFIPPKGVDGESLYRDWFESFETKPSPESKRALDERRRHAGESLFKALFSSAAPQIQEHLKVLDDRQRAENGERPDDTRVVTASRGLRVRLILGNAWGNGSASADALLPISSLPHELMVPSGLPMFLARRSFVSIVRTIGVAEFVGPMSVSGKLRVLIANAQPKGSAPLGWEEEADKIQSALKGRTDTTVEVLKNASFEATWQRLRNDKFHVLHFIGHGGFDAASGQWYLLFERNGEREPVLAETIAERLGNMPMLRLAVLNACHSGELASEAGGNPLAGIAAALSVYGLPAVVGMQVAVTDSAAVNFSNAFYGALRERGSIEVAVADGRSAVDISSPEWATPVLYLRGETSDLFDFEVRSNGPVIRADGPPELKLGIRTLVESEKFPHLADWAKKLETSTEKLLPLEEYFDGRFIIDPGMWGSHVLPRLNRFLADAVEQDRPLLLNLVAHSTVAFAAGYYFHTKTATKISLLQVTSGQTLRWSEKEGTQPQGLLWQPFTEIVLDPQLTDVAVAVEVTQNTSDAVRTYLSKDGPKLGRLITARIAGEPGKTRIESGVHAYQLAWQLHQWLKDHTGNHSQRRLHLFLSAPNGFLFFFGQLARSLGPVRLYEFDFEGTNHGTYEPSLGLPQTAFE